MITTPPFFCVDTDSSMCVQVDKRGLPVPSSGGMLKLLMRRQSSQPSQPADSESSSPGNDEFNPSLATPTSEQPSTNTLYGDQNQDQGGEVRFSVELTRLDRLENTYSLDIRRLKGNLKSYKFLYDSLREYVDSKLPRTRFPDLRVFFSDARISTAIRVEILRGGFLGFSFSRIPPFHAYAYCVHVCSSRFF